MERNKICAGPVWNGNYSGRHGNYLVIMVIMLVSCITKERVSQNLYHRIFITERVSQLLLVLT